ncbi:MAG: DNA repair protein RecN [Vicinamibacterales bacterium]|nr:DNA repair protein RecN [Vicinamibacterales bacterium]
MIRYLAIRNLAVIESVAVEFEQSFNVLTGETGAGKSILVEAVGLLLGGRASQDLVRTGEDLATVEAIFETQDGTEITVRREITAQGRSRAFVDGALATAGQLRELATTLVELHGQHEHQDLLNPESHIPLLDGWAGLAPRQAETAAAWEGVRELRTQIERMRMDDRERAARLELVEFQLGELQTAALTPGEDEVLQAERQVLKSADLVQRLCGEAYAELYEDEQAVLTGLDHVWKRVGELAAIDASFAAHLDGRDAIKAQLEDLAFTLRDYGDRVDLTPGRLQDVEDRLALIERLVRKHGPTLADALARQAALEAEQCALAGGSASLEDLEAALAAASTAFLAAATRLSDARREAAPAFARALERELADLAMDRTRFEVRLTRDDSLAAWSAQGIDRGEFFLSPNPGEELRPLARIASGGELSRIMLALKTLATADQPGKTLIFDEVDAGIGGRVASSVGQRLHGLGGRFQVLCITHLPQIAAAGGTHFHIEKAVRGTRTVTSVTRLDAAGRVEEIARMIGGAATTDQVRASARDLIAGTAPAKGESGQGAKAKGESPRGAKAKAR